MFNECNKIGDFFRGKIERILQAEEQILKRIEEELEISIHRQGLHPYHVQNANGC